MAVFREVWTPDNVQRQIIESSQEANRQTTSSVEDLVLTPVRVSEDTTARLGQIILVDTTTQSLSITLPNTTQADIGRLVIIKLWSGSPWGWITIKAPLDGHIDGNVSWSLNSAFSGVSIMYVGNNDWAIVSKVSGLGVSVII